MEQKDGLIIHLRRSHHRRRCHSGQLKFDGILSGKSHRPRLNQTQQNGRRWHKLTPAGIEDEVELAADKVELLLLLLLLSARAVDIG
jgi:hypothetical protein